MSTLKTDLERLVYSTNTVLIDKVHDMGYIALLRNLHPIYRSDFAMKLFRQNLITKEETHEFVKIM